MWGQDSGAFPGGGERGNFRVGHQTSSTRIGASRSVSFTQVRGSRRVVKQNYDVRQVWRRKGSTAFKESEGESSAIVRSRSAKLVKEPGAREDVIRSNSRLQRFVWHPWSSKRLAWDLASMLLLAYDIITIPFVGAFSPSPTAFTVTMTWLTLIFWSLDMVASLLTGFQRGKYTVLAPRMILVHYLRTWFALDLAIMTLDWSLVMVGDDTAGSTARLGRSLRTLRFIRTLRLMRLVKLKRLLQGVQDMINTEAVSICFGVLKTVIVLVLMNHIVGCIWYSIGVMDGDNSWVTTNSLETRTLIYKYSTSLHWSLTQFTPASMEVHPENVKERIFAVLVLLGAMVTFSSFVSMLTASMGELRRLRNDESRQFWLLRRYLKDWGVSRKMSTRIQRYLEYAYAKQRQRVQEKDVALLSLLTEPLRQELKHETYWVTLQQHPLFHECETIRVFSSSLSSQSLARGDVLFFCGDEATQVFFLSAGTFEYALGDTIEKTDGSKSLCATTKAMEIREGEWLSEPALWTEWLHLGDVEAVTECQMISVDVAKFGEAVAGNKPLWYSMSRYAGLFVKRLNDVAKEELTDLSHQLFSPLGIVAQCTFLKSFKERDVSDETESTWGKFCTALIGPRYSTERADDASSNAGPPSKAVRKNLVFTGICTPATVAPEPPTSDAEA